MAAQPTLGGLELINYRIVVTFCTVCKVPLYGGKHGCGISVFQMFVGNYLFDFFKILNY